MNTNKTYRHWLRQHAFYSLIPQKTTTNRQKQKDHVGSQCHSFYWRVWNYSQPTTTTVESSPYVVPFIFPLLEEPRTPAQRSQHAQCSHSQCKHHFRTPELESFTSPSLHTAHARAERWGCQSRTAEFALYGDSKTAKYVGELLPWSILPSHLTAKTEAKQGIVSNFFQLKWCLKKNT